ncbi:MAG: hypothetical protein JNM27_09435 [Leptospirales bacterium]|nr:hypothetical protein [Leptospirales bacterium]
MQKNLGIIFPLLFVSLACGSQSPTGKQGPLGAPYDATGYYTTLKREGVMPKNYEKNLAAIQTAFSEQKRITHKQRIRIADGDLSTTVIATWQTLPVGNYHLILIAQLEASEYSKGTSCKLGDFSRISTEEPYFDAVQAEITCTRTNGSEHKVISRSFLWNGAAGVNQPLVPNGKLHVEGAEISNY